MPHDLMLKGMNAVHRGLLKVSGGRVGWSGMGMPVLELTTIGRKSGQPRSVMLTTPISDGDSMIIVASRGGDDTHPAWFLNLRDNPDVEVATQGKPSRKMTARVATTEERARLWPQLNEGPHELRGLPAQDRPRDSPRVPHSDGLTRILRPPPACLRAIRRAGDLEGERGSDDTIGTRCGMLRRYRCVGTGTAGVDRDGGPR